MRKRIRCCIEVLKNIVLKNIEKNLTNDIINDVKLTMKVVMDYLTTSTMFMNDIHLIYTIIHKNHKQEII